MTLLLREVGGFLLGAAAWVGFELAIAAAAGVIGVLAVRADPARSLGVGFVGATAVAALAVRIGAPLAWAPIIGGRPLPVAWSIAGAVVAVTLVVATRREAPADP